MKIPFDYSSFKTDMVIDNKDFKNVSLMKRDTKKIDKFENFLCGNSLFQNLPRFMISVFWCCLNDAYYAHAQWSKSYYKRLYTVGCFLKDCLFLYRTILPSFLAQQPLSTSKDLICSYPCYLRLRFFFDNILKDQIVTFYKNEIA